MKCFNLIFVLLISTFAFGQLAPTEIQIPMRDGQALAADLYLPNQSSDFPTILIQTPYNKNTYRTRGLPLGIRDNIGNSKYAFVIADWRCFFGSTAACVGQANRGEDGYDAVEWIAEQQWSNGKIGTWGPSALGNVQFNTAYEQPPHLICAVPEVCSPQTAYNDFYPGGVLVTGRYQTLNGLYGNAFTPVIENPFYNNIWQFIENNTYSPELISIPMLLVAGWYDHNLDVDINLLSSIQENSAAAVQNQHKLLIGPWVHGGTGQAYVGSANQGELVYQNASLKNHEYELAFFDFHLRDINNGWADTATISYYIMGDNTWKSTPTWPPAATDTTRYFLDFNNQLSLNNSNTGSLSAPYNPLDPSPTTGGKTLSQSTVQGPLDQSTAVESRSDAIVFSTDVLDEDLVVEGKISCQLFCSADVTDTDFMLRLTDVYPDGRSMLLGEAVTRLRYRNGNRETDVALGQPNTTYALNFEFEHLAITFKAGHKIRLIITGSNYPHYNRNMNTGAEMYPDNKPDTVVNPVVANQTIHFGPQTPSHITLPIIARSTSIKETNEATARLFPNPSAGIFQWNDALNFSDYELYNTEGKKIKAGKMPLENRLDFRDCKPGAYTLLLSNGIKRQVHHLVIDK